MIPTLPKCRGCDACRMDPRAHGQWEASHGRRLAVDHVPASKSLVPFGRYLGAAHAVRHDEYSTRVLKTLFT